MYHCMHNNSVRGVGILMDQLCGAAIHKAAGSYLAVKKGNHLGIHVASFSNALSVCRKIEELVYQTNILPMVEKSGSCIHINFHDTSYESNSICMI